MSNYIPWYGKKNDICKVNEERVQRLLKDYNGLISNKLRKAVEKLRDSRVSVLRSAQAQIVPVAENAARLEEYDDLIAVAKAKSIEDILSEFV